MTTVQTLNYTAHAIDDLNKTAEILKHRMPESSRAILKIIELLRMAQKFILPNCCDLFDPEEMKQSHLDLFHLPYPVCVFEAPWIKEDPSQPIAHVEGLPTAISTKRISLCWEPVEGLEILPGLYDILQKFEQGGVFVIPIFWTVEGGWSIAIGGSFVPYDNQLMSLESESRLMPESKAAMLKFRETGQASESSKHFLAEPFYVLPEMFALQASQVGENNAFQQIILDSHDEVMMATQACAILNCENIRSTEIKPDQKLNSKREKNGKEPFAVYRVLHISDESSAATTHGKGGSHNSPKMHLRRGHIRRYADGRTVWVKSSIVNANSKQGVVQKDYRVKS